MNTEIMKTWFLFSVSIGIWTIMVLSVRQPINRKLTVLLSIFVALLLVPSSSGYLELAFNTRSLDLLGMSLTWSYGPMAYLIIRQALLYKNSIVLISTFFMPWFLVFLDLNMNAWIVRDFVWYVSILIVFTLCFVLASIHFFWANIETARKLIGEYRGASYYWLLFIVVGLIGLLVFDFSIVVMLHLGVIDSLLVVRLVACVLNLYVCTICFCVAYQPKIFHSVEAVDVESQEQEIPKPRSVELSVSASEELDKKLGVLICEYKPHLDDDISLGKLALLMGITRNQMSEFFNVHKGESFYSYLNKLRVEESKKLLVKGAGRHSVSDIAYLSGFNNRNSFYASFKKCEGMTPSEYRKSGIQGAGLESTG